MRFCFSVWCWEAGKSAIRADELLDCTTALYATYNTRFTYNWHWTFWVAQEASPSGGRRSKQCSDPPWSAISVPAWSDSLIACFLLQTSVPLS
jgi:hypothetical protein